MKPLVYKKARRPRKGQLPVIRIKLHIAKGDLVQVISGDDKGKRGAVLRVYPKTGRITVDGVNIVKRHRRATQTTEGGIIERPNPIHHSKMMLIDPKSGEPTRVRRKRDADGTVERIAVKSGQPIARSR
jgi:large subunit ribosomal protein L24